MTTREELIAAMRATAGAPPKPVPVPGWGTIYVRSLTVEQVDLQQQEPKPEGDASGDRLRFAKAAARVMCDENGKLLFDVTNQEDLELLAAQPWESLSKIMNAGGDESATTQAGSEEVKKG